MEASHKEFTEDTFYLDYHTESLKNFVSKHLQGESETEKVVSLYYAVRDRIKYDPYHIVLKKDELRASRIVERRYGFCVEKALLLAACIRSIGVPTKLGFANVKNHLTSQRLSELMKTDVFVFHGYTDIFLNGKWVKATPAFNNSLCERTGTLPLDFDGKTDSIFHPLDKEGKKHMEYLKDFGSFPDLPYDRMMDEYEEHYSHLKVKENLSFGNFRIKGDFEKEARGG